MEAVVIRLAPTLLSLFLILAIFGSPAQPGETKALTPGEERALRPRDNFKECDHCPAMVVVPAGGLKMGSPQSEADRSPEEGPLHTVVFAKPFAAGRFAITFEKWDACVAAGGCDGHVPSDEGWGRGRRPVINVSWYDAKAYVAWLSRRTGADYRLLSEAEWEYVARAGTTTPFWWGASLSTIQANYKGDVVSAANPGGEYRRQTLPVGAFEPNPWGLYQVHGNVYDWIEDCFNETYHGAPSDGSAWTMGDCDRRGHRGGSWFSNPWALRSAARNRNFSFTRFDFIGFRVARSLAR
jgi:formylglycine-generating enzyme required for sulfatase activity